MEGKPHGCSTCKKTFSRKDNLKQHSLTHKEQKEKIKCTDCGKTFSSKSNLTRHKRSHQNEGNVMCDICGKTFTRVDLLKKHVIGTHNIGKQLQCKTCKKVFKHKHNLKEHETAHSRKSPCVCAVCGACFAHKRNLTRHKLNCGKGKRPKQTLKNTRQSSSLDHKCPICDQVFTRKDSLQRHACLPSEEKKYSCSHCGKSWTRKGKLKSHTCVELPTSFQTPSTSSEPVKKQMARHRKLKDLKSQVSKLSPESKRSLVKSAIEKSPNQNTWKALVAEKYMNSKEGQKQQQMYEAVVQDASEVMETLKKSRSKAANNIRQKSAAIMTVGKNVNKARLKCRAAKTLFVPKTSRRVEQKNIRSKILSGDQAVLIDACRKAKGMKYSEEQRRNVSDYWKNEASHPSTDSKRPVRKRIGKNEYLSHTRHISTKSTREAFVDFKRKHPDIQISETLFSRLKPFFVKAPTGRDLQQCCCQTCTILKKAFRALMLYRAKHKIEPIFPSLHDMVKETLCSKTDDDGEYELSCLQRQCNLCGISKLSFDNKETDITTTEKVTWWTFDYVTNDDGKKRLTYLKKVTQPFELVNCIKKSLSSYALHVFTSKWQRTQWQNLIADLPATHVALECDFSENLARTIQEEVQSLHWATKQVTIHSMVIWRPKCNTDNVADTHVKEHWMVFSDDLKHDFHFVHKTIKDIVIYELKKMGCHFTELHCSSDGCAAQYKSCNVFGDMSRSEKDLGIPITWSYSASGHGKGEVDSAAGVIKTAARKAVISQVDETVIQCANDLHRFCVQHFETAIQQSSSAIHTRRFFELKSDDIVHESRGNYATILGTQKLHWVSSCNVDGQLKVRNLSCYCLYCIVKNYQQCINSAYVNVPKLVTFSPDVPSSSTAEPQNQNEDNEGDKSEDVPETVSMA